MYFLVNSNISCLFWIYKIVKRIFILYPPMQQALVLSTHVNLNLKKTVFYWYQMLTMLGADPPEGKLPFECQNIAKNCQKNCQKKLKISLFSKQMQKIVIFSQKFLLAIFLIKWQFLAFLMTIFGNIFWMTIFWDSNGNFPEGQISNNLIDHLLVRLWLNSNLPCSPLLSNCHPQIQDGFCIWLWGSTPWQ